MVWNKKGVSPLIATLLLMGFAIALGTVVMSWGRSYIEDKAEFVGNPEFSGCGNVDLRLITVGGEVQSCYDGKQIHLLLENSPDLSIQNLQAQLVGTSGIANEDGILKEPLKRAHALKKSIPYEGIGTPVKVKLTPLVNINNVDLYCDESSIVIEDELHPCE